MNEHHVQETVKYQHIIYLRITKIYINIINICVFLKSMLKRDPQLNSN